MGPVLGIDFGSSKCSAAVYYNDQVKVINDPSGSSTIPSFVSFSRNEKFIGSESKRNVDSSSFKTIHRFKKHFGKYDEDEKVTRPRNVFPISFEYMKHQMKIYQENLLALFISKFKRQAEKDIEEIITECVITVPNHFTDKQREAIKDACHMCDLHVLAVMNDTTAIAVNYVFSKSFASTHYAIICDIGAESTKMSTMEVSNVGVRTIAEESLEIGGNWIDDRIYEHFKKEKNHFTLSDAERLKRVSSRLGQKTIHLARNNGEKNEIVSMTDDEFKEILGPFLELVHNLLDRLVDPSKITNVVLNGGTTRMKIVRNVFSNYFDSARLVTDLAQETAVAEGAALYGALLKENIDWDFTVTGDFDYPGKAKSSSEKLNRMCELHRFLMHDDFLREGRESAMCDLESLCLKTRSRMKKEKTLCDSFLDKIRKDILDACEQGLNAVEGNYFIQMEKYVERKTNLEYLLNVYVEHCENNHASFAAMSNIVKNQTEGRKVEQSLESDDSIGYFIVDRTQGKRPISISPEAVLADALKQASADGEEAAADGEEADALKQASADGEEAAADGEEAAADGEEAAADGEEAAADGEEAAADGEEAAADGEEAAADGEEAVADGEEAAVDGEEAAVEGEEGLENWEMPEDVSLDEEWVVV